MSTFNRTYECDAWLVDEDDQINHSLPAADAMFLIQMYAHIIPYDSIMEAEGTNTSATTAAASLFSKEFQVKRDYLLDEITSWSAVSNIVAEMNIPLDVLPFMMLKIMGRARECRDMDRKVIPMIVQLRTTIHTEANYSSAVSDAILDSFDSQRIRFVGASKSAIEALEKVLVQDSSRQCVICLEDIPVGTDATCMPCKHIYHGSCISSWLENSNCCPLCRSHICT